MAAGDGLISMKPTSIAHAGTAASINADGGVDFTAVTSLSLNGVFTGDYDNYLIVISDDVGSVANSYMRLRVSGTDATASDYTYQYLIASSGSILVARSGFSAALIGNPDTAQNGTTVHVYGPALAQPTAFRSLQANSGSGATLYDVASTHSLSTAYDGFTYYVNTSSTTGTVHVFGYEE